MEYKVGDLILCKNDYISAYSNNKHFTKNKLYKIVSITSNTFIILRNNEGDYNMHRTDEFYTKQETEKFIKRQEYNLEFNNKVKAC